MPEHRDAYSEEGQVIVLEDGGDVGEPAGDALTALLTLIDDTTQTLTAANLESFYGMIPRWSWENRGLLETRITALMNAVNAAQHTWEHFQIAK